MMVTYSLRSWAVMIIMEKGKDIPPQEDVEYLSTWKHSKLQGEETLIITNSSSSSKIQRSQLEISFSRLEHCGDPLNAFLLPDLPPNGQPCAILLCFYKLVKQPISSQPPKSNHCTEGLWETCLTLWHKGVGFVSCFPYAGAFIFKVPRTQPGSLRSVTGAIQRALHGAGGGSCSKLQPCICQRRADSNPKRSPHLPVVGSHIQRTPTKNQGYLGSVITETL